MARAEALMRNFGVFTAPVDGWVSGMFGVLAPPLP